MAKRAPPYSWVIDINEEDNRLKEEFIQSYGEELKLNKRYIDSYEKADIKRFRLILSDNILLCRVQRYCGGGSD